MFDDVKNKLINIKIVNYKYVYYWTKVWWDSNKKHSADDRVCIGKKENEYFIPNDKYRELFKVVINSEPGHFDTNLTYGPYIALLTSALKFGCYDALKNVFPNTYKNIFALAISFICNEDSSAQHFEHWSFSNYCGINDALTSPRISELYASITEANVTSFLEWLLVEYKKRKIISDKTALAFDSTNQNTTANVNLAEYGHAKDDKTIPIINTCYVVDENTGIPVFYEHYYGSLLDKSECPITTTKIKNLGFKKLFLILDRGYFSSKNLECLNENEFGMMCPINNQTVQELLAEYKITIKDNEKYYIPDENIYGIKKRM